MTAGIRGPRSLVLLHLSDIHLQKAEIASSQDLDEDIRARLLVDVARSELPPGVDVDAILVTGDVAFGGKDTEYEAARKWLQALCAKVRCPESNVWLVPGNHDVDRDVVTKSAMIRDMHAMIRKDPDPAHALVDRMRDDVAAQALLSPFAEYNIFAQQYQSETTVDQVHWESSDCDDDLTLNDGSHLRLRGINSSIISDKSGENGPPKGPATEVVGLRQVQLRDEQEGIAYLTLCHHPPDWLLDGDVVQDALTSRARIQLFGHKHHQRVRKVNNSLVLGAGALHPNRGEAGWQPRYNIIRLEVRGQPSERKLHVEVYQRAWKSADTHFGKEVDADGKYPKEFVLELGPWSPPEPQDTVSVTPKPQTPSTFKARTTNPISVRDLIFRLLALSYPIRMRILTDLALLEDADRGISDSDLVKKTVSRARERAQLTQLEEAVKTAAPKV